MRILIVTKNWLGDILFQLPTIQAIRKNHPDATIVCMTPKRCEGLLRAHPAVDEVLVFDERAEQKSPLSKLKFLAKLRTRRWDKAFLLHPSRTRALFVFFAGAKERVGYQKGRKFLLTKPVVEPEQTMHQVDYFLHLLHKAGYPLSEENAYQFFFSEEAKNSINKILIQKKVLPKNFISFHLGANWQPKRWPAAFFGELADLLHDEWKLPIVITGANRDLPLFHECQLQSKKAKLINLVGQTSLEELAALMQQSLCLITADSGPMHIASGVGTPVLALFGPTNPVLTGPRGIGPKRVIHHVPEGLSCPWFGDDESIVDWMSGIQVREVFDALRIEGWIEEGLKTNHESSKSESVALASSKQSQQGARILLVSLSNIGDAVLTTPVLMSLKSQFPEALITVVAGPKSAVVFEGSYYVDRLLIYDKHASLAEKKEFLMALRRESYDYVVDLRNTAIPFLVKAKKRSPLFRSKNKMLKRDLHLEVLRQMKLQSDVVEKFDFYHESDKLSVVKLFEAEGVESNRPLIAISPVAASKLKTWYLESFKDVLEGLLKDPEVVVCILGDEREAKIAEPLVALDPERVFNFAGRLHLRESSCLIDRAELLLTNDSALMHIAFELDKPVVAIFGPTDPNLYGREGKKIRLMRSEVIEELNGKTVHRGNREDYFKGLAPAQVLKACQELLNENRATVEA